MQNALDKYLEYAATVLRFFRNHNLSITASAVGFDQSSRKKWRILKIVEWIVHYRRKF